MLKQAWASFSRATRHNAPPWWAVLCMVALVTYLQHIFASSVAEGHDSVPVSILWPTSGTLGYLVAVAAGKRWMRGRAAHKLTGAMVLYNVYQVGLNLWWCYACLHEVLLGAGKAAGGGAGAYNLSFLIWVHYQNKYVELADTMFMLLRKKNQQISFLHVYHHAMLIWAWYFVCAYAPGGEAYFGALCNSAVHVVMYSYYAMALLRIQCPWKRYITMVQMAQFVVCFAHAVWCLWTGAYPAWLCACNIFVMVNMLVLFGRFYVKAYAKKRATKKAAARKSE